MEQVFFAPDNDNQQWSVVIQKEPRSRRVEDDSDEGVIGATGYSTPLTFDDTSMNDLEGNAGSTQEGVPVPAEEVVALDAAMEVPIVSEPLAAMEHEDDDDDEDVDVDDNRDTEEVMAETPLQYR